MNLGRNRKGGKEDSSPADMMMNPGFSFRSVEQSGAYNAYKNRVSRSIRIALYWVESIRVNN